MRFAPLTMKHSTDWAALLAGCFHRSPEDMELLLGWLHQLGHLIAWGAWDDERLVAQYACLLRPLNREQLLAGMSINMAVHSDYRGRGLVKQVAAHVYNHVQECGGSLGIGFSNAEGVKVDHRSSSYGYSVVGKMQPMIGLPRRREENTLDLTDTFPEVAQFAPVDVNQSHLCFAVSPQSLHSRYENHPFRDYHYGVWQEDSTIYGMVIYRAVVIGGIRGVSLLDAYGVDLYELLARWSSTIDAQFIHVLVTPDAALKHTLTQIMPMIPQPYTRNPYYLTLKPLIDIHPDLYNFNAWDFCGGCVL